MGLPQRSLRRILPSWSVGLHSIQRLDVSVLPVFKPARGPAFEAKSGIVVLARRSGSPIVPITAAFGRSLELKKAWDRFRIPFPFARATVTYGEPILVSKKATSQQMRETTDRLTESLRALTVEVDVHGPQR